MKNIIIFLLSIVITTVLLIIFFKLIIFLYDTFIDIRDEILKRADGLINKEFYSKRARLWAYNLVEKECSKDTEEDEAKVSLKRTILWHEEAKGNVEFSRHGDWGKGAFPMCSCCRSCMPIDTLKYIKEFNYCPYCGAKMDGKDTNVRSKEG